MKRNHLQLWKNGENDNGDWQIGKHKEKFKEYARKVSEELAEKLGIETDPTLMPSDGELEMAFREMYVKRPPSWVKDYKLWEFEPGKGYRQFINNTGHPVEIKLHEGHTFNMYPGMSMMIPPSIEKPFYRYMAINDRYSVPMFPFNGDWWHLREPGKSISDLQPIQFGFRSYTPTEADIKWAKGEITDMINFKGDALHDEVGLVDTGIRRGYYALDWKVKSVASNWIYAINYLTRLPMFKINRRPSHFEGYYREYCPFCGIPDTIRECTEQANCLNISMAAEEKMKQRDAFIDHGAYPAPGDKEFNEQWSTLQAEDDIEQSRRESTVAGFRGYKDPKYKPKKR